MEDIDDEDTLPRNVAPLNSSHLLELSDGSDNEVAPEVIEVDDNTEEESEEDAEAELGQL
jgi:hypothetical protein